MLIELLGCELVSNRDPPGWVNNYYNANFVSSSSGWGLYTYVKCVIGGGAGRYVA